MIKNVRAIKGEKSFETEIKKLAKKHGKVQIIFADSENGGLRKRILTKDGTCLVCYKGRGYKKWSNYESSCFMDYCEEQYHFDGSRVRNSGKKKTLNNTIKAMRDHDSEYIVPLEVSYGPKFKTSVIVVRQYDK